MWQRRTDWREGSVRCYLLLLARNICFDHTRRSAVRVRLAHHVRDVLPAGVLTPADELDTREIETAIAQAVQELSPRRREAFVLVHLHGLSYQEAAEVMGVSRATLSNQVGSAVGQLRARLKGLL